MISTNSYFWFAYFSIIWLSSVFSVLIVLAIFRHVQLIRMRDNEAFAQRMRFIVADVLLAENSGTHHLRRIVSRLPTRKKEICEQIILGMMGTVRGAEASRLLQLLDSLGALASISRDLASSSWRRRARAAIMATYIRNPGWRAALGALLHDPRAQVAVPAARALAFIREEQTPGSACSKCDARSILNVFVRHPASPRMLAEVLGALALQDSAIVRKILTGESGVGAV